MTEEFLINKFFLFLTVSGQLLVLFLVISILIKKRGKKIISHIGNNALTYILLVSVVATIGSLAYSQKLGYEPCILCWFQRIFLFPQVIIAAMAAIKRDKGIFDYLFALSFVGALFAFYHSYLQMFGGKGIFCDVVSPDCSIPLVLEWGYVTIPMMSLTVFLLLAVLSFIGKRN